MSGLSPPSILEFCNSKLNSAISSLDKSSHNVRSDVLEIGGAPVKIRLKLPVTKQVSVRASSILIKIVTTSDEIV